MSELSERVHEIQAWFADRNYVLLVHAVPHGGFFAPYFPAHHTGGSAPYTWAETAEGAAEAAMVEFIAAHPDST